MSEHVHSAAGAGRPAVREGGRAVVVPLVGAGVGGGLVGGLLMIGLMILVMGASGAGWATPLNLGMAAFVFTITPPMAMLPTLMSMMGLHLPPSAMAMLAPLAKGGHLAPGAMAHLQAMLMGMHLPAATVAAMGALLSGKATNGDVVTLMHSMGPSAQAAVMAAMPVVAGQVVVGTILHFAFSAVIGVVFASIIIGAARLGLPGMRTSAGAVGAGVIGGALLYVLMRWGVLPALNPMMTLVPEGWFFVAHLLYGLAVGVFVALALRRRSLRGALLGVPS